MAKSLSRFFIRKQDEKNEIATLFFRVQNKKHKVDTLFSSQIRVNVAEWKEALSCPEKWMRHQRANFNLHDSLNRIELVVKSEVEGMSFDKSHVEAEILAIANPKKAEAIMKAKREEEERQREEERIKEEQERLIKEGIDAERAKIWNFIDRFCNEIKSGARLNGHDRYAPGTVKAWNSFRKLYDLFDRKHRNTWYDVDRAFVTKFLNFMEKKDYMVTAQNKYLVDLRAIISYAYADGIHNNDRALQYFAKKKIEEKDKAIEIYLTEAELQALYEMPLSGKQEEVRDIFLVGCYTCQRVSDYNDIDKDCFTTTAKGTPVIRLIQKKTRNEVKIPIMNPNLKAICEKYDYNLPYVVDVILNRYIKEILKELSGKVPDLARMVVTKLTQKQKKLVEVCSRQLVQRDLPQSRDDVPVDPQLILLLGARPESGHGAGLIPVVQPRPEGHAGFDLLGLLRRAALLPQGFQLPQALPFRFSQAVLRPGIPPLVIAYHAPPLPAAILSQVDAAAAGLSPLCHGVSSFPKISVIKVSITWAACRCISPVTWA